MEKSSKELHEIIVTAETKTTIALKNIFLQNIFSFQSCVNILAEACSFVIFSV